MKAITKSRLKMTMKSQSILIVQRPWVPNKGLEYRVFTYSFQWNASSPHNRKLSTRWGN